MKALWLSNVAIHRVDEIINDDKRNFFGGGWLDGLSDQLLSHQDFELILCYPAYGKSEPVKGKKDNFSFYGFVADGRALRIGNADSESFEPFFEEVIKKEKPDIIHIHGTEFQYCYAMCCVAEKLGLLNKVVISVQGLVGIYAEHLFAGLPMSVIKSCTLKELLTKDNIYETYKAYVRRGKYEKQSLQMVSHIMGRTSWDKACALQYNPDCSYHFSNETLRKVFYSDQWEYASCNKHSIFISQAVLPLKGAHMLVKAVSMLKDKYPDIRLKIAGADITQGNKIKGSSYGLYLKKLIKQEKVIENVEFIGPQNALQMKRQLLSCNVFVSPSSIENSPNSLGEAMLLGVPCISSDVGGVADMLVHKKEGYVYPFDEYYMLAYYIDKAFEAKDTITEMTVNARKHAEKTHDPEMNSDQVMRIYKDIIK
ncbi:MAG: glycosyltransferase family 4 protein [Oscillospiraceae bacterium]